MKKERDRGRNRFFCKKRSRHGFQPSKKRPISLWRETTDFHDIDGKAPRRAVHDHVCREAHASRCCRGRRYEGRDAVRRELAVVCSALAGPHRATALAHYNSICEKQKWYYHLNFTTKIKGAGPNECNLDNLFFVEVKCMPQAKFTELLPNCFCRVNLNDNGQCYGCTRDGDVGMKHPSSSVGYTAGHLNVGLPSGYYGKWKRDYEDEEDDDKYVKAREAELRQMFKGLDKPGVLKKLITPPPWATKRKVLG